MARLSLRSPLGTLRRSRDLLDDAWSDFPGFSMFRRGDEDVLGVWSPRVDIYETNDDIVVECELPGMHKDDIHVDVEGDRLSIRGERNEEKETEGRSYYRSERHYASFDRSFTLPAGIEADQVEAEYRDGILSIVLPKTETAKAKHVKVK